MVDVVDSFDTTLTSDSLFLLALELQRAPGTKVVRLTHVTATKRTYQICSQWLRQTVRSRRPSSQVMNEYKYCRRC